MFLREKARQYKKFLETKALAIENEDYEVAKRLKEQIDQERRQIEQGYGIDSQTGLFYPKS